MSKKIFVTGATGFIGGHFVNNLPNEVEVIGLKRRVSIPRVYPRKGIKWICKDLNEIKSEDLFNIDALVHFASFGVSPQKASWDELYYFNVINTLSLLQAAAEAGVGRVIIAGTSAEYGLSSDSFEFIPTSAALLPTTPYASSKAACFELAYAFCLKSKIPLFYNRIFSAFGEGQFEENFWPSLRKAAFKGEDFPMTSGTQIRDFIHVKQVAQSFVEDLFSDVSHNESPQIKNVCSGVGITLREFAQTHWSQWDAKGKLLLGYIPSREGEQKRSVGLKKEFCRKSININV